MNNQSPRIAAISLLVRVLDHRQTLDEALAQDDRFSALEGADRGFARALVSASLRWLGFIDHALAPLVSGRPFNGLDAGVKHILRMGVAQICVLRTPLHAAVSETVETARFVDDARKAGGLINAVLRKIRPETLDELDLPADAIWPDAFRTRMSEALGEHVAQELAEAAGQIPPLDLTCPTDRSLWAERLAGEEIGPVSVRMSEGLVESLPGYENGDWWVQDVAASLPVQVLAPKNGEAILDMCAAPGGKTLQIAASGASVTAVDRAAKRMRLVEQNLKRTGLTANCVTADATKWDAPEPFDGVLVDAPCSALGTLRRHPEGPWIKQAADLDRFPTIQAKLLETAAAKVKPGGRLVYCVCTPLPAEGMAIVDAFLDGAEDWQRDAIIGADVPGFESAITDAGDVLTLPSTCPDERGCDTFFIARLVKAEH
ncbi:MAG: rRNA methyltransferase [Ponticaulis sp.]|nr:rRNA methyltransferase [Ponticaulis sp.]